MLLNLPPQILVLLIPSLIFALSFHEFSHAWMAKKCGDNTAASLGRLSLNPMAHLDLIGSIMILFVGFGWAKPVPVNSFSLNNPRKDMMKIAAAGPLSNLLLALIASLIFRISSIIGLNLDYLLFYFIQINISLAVFNMIPISPLDGSQIFTGYLSKRNPDLAVKIQTYGPQVLLGLILFGYITGFSIIWLFIRPIVKVFMYVFAGINI
tara:strand:- start:4182 stop:4808 length:627 start_codon:yes stop_codon:yes gene_type:complete